MGGYSDGRHWHKGRWHATIWPARILAESEGHRKMGYDPETGEVRLIRRFAKERGAVRSMQAYHTDAGRPLHGSSCSACDMLRALDAWRKATGWEIWDQ